MRSPAPSRSVDVASHSSPKNTAESLAQFVQRLAVEGVLRSHQAVEIVERSHEPSDERWGSPFLRDVREHTRAYVDALCVGPTHIQINKPLKEANTK